MSLSDRLRRIAQGVGDRVKDSLHLPSHEEWEARRRWKQAEAEARAEVNAMPPPSISLPDRVDVPRTTAPGATPRPAETADTPRERVPVARPAVESALSPHYAVLELRDGANIQQVERSYRRLKERCNPAQFEEDALAQARARQEDARLDEAYLALRQALVRERRL